MKLYICCVFVDLSAVHQEHLSSILVSVLAYHAEVSGLSLLGGHSGHLAVEMGSWQLREVGK